MAQPTYSSGNGYISENFFTLVFDVALDAANPPPTSAFVVQINGTPVSVTGLTVNSADKSVVLTFSGGFLTAGDIIEYSYVDPSGGNDVNAVQGLDGLDAATFNASTIVYGGRPGPSAPPAPALLNTSDTGTLGDGITQDITPTLTGSAGASATIKLYDTDGATLLGSTVSDGSGNWEITSSALSSGSHSLKVTQTDSSNATSPLSAGLALTIDTTAAAPTGLALSSGSDSGTLGDGITNDGTPTITGSAEANAAVTLYDTDGTTVLGTATANGSGNWSITSSTLAQGSHTLTAKQTDVAGNVSAASSGFAYNLDTVGPTGMALSTNQIALSNAGNGATVATLSATDASAISYDFAVGNGTIDADNGKFAIVGNQLQAAQNLSSGTYHLYVKATDAAGNDSFQIFSVAVVEAPSVTAINRVESATVPASGTSVNYSVTFNQSVTGVDASDFTLTAAGTASGTIASVSGSGDTYTVTVNGLSGDGTLRLDLNSSGTGILNGSSVAITGGYTAGQSFTLDHTAPASPSTPMMTSATDTGISASDAITSNQTPTFTGTGQANATVTLYDTDGTTVLGSASVDGSGNWSVTSSVLAAGSHALTVKQVDAAGNTSAASSALSVVIDNTVANPAAPLLASVSDSGTLGDGITNITTPTITGTAEANATVSLYDTDGITVLGTTVANGSGAWSIVSSVLANGPHTLTAKQADVAGNVSSASVGLSLTIDDVPPSAPSTPLLSAASDSGTQGDGITNIARPVITGTAAANATVQLYDTDGTTLLGTTVANSGGAWSITSSALALGEHTLTVKQTDLAGNLSAASAGLSLTLEAAPTPTPTPPPATATTIDGVNVTQQQVSLPGGGSGTRVIVPVIDAGRIDSSGSSGVADIPLVASGGSNLLIAQLSPGFGLTATGGSSQSAGTSSQQLIQAILAVTPDHPVTDQEHLTGNGVTFLGKLAASVPLLIETITPVTGSTAPTSPLTLTGTSSSSQHTALVIDTTQMASASTLSLNQVDFAAIVGSANVIGNTADQILTGDAASQQFSVNSGSNSSVFSGGGNDVLNINFATSSTPSTGNSASILHGGQGGDTVTFSGASSDYVIENHEGYIRVISNTQPSQQAVLINAETVSFADTTVTVQATAAQTELSGLYQSVLGRQADYQGFDYWAVEAKNGVSMGSIALSLITSTEAQGGPALVLNGNATNDIEMLYQGIFGRQSDSQGKAYWVSAMEQGMTLDQVATGFIQAAEMDQHKVAAVNWDFIV